MLPRYRLRLAKLVQKHPFWSASRLVNHLHNKFIAAAKELPPGAVVKVELSRGVAFANPAHTETWLGVPNSEPGRTSSVPCCMKVFIVNTAHQKAIGAPSKSDR